MRKFAILFLVVLFAVSLGTVYAIDDPAAGPQAMARYFPENTAVFAAFRTDEGYIDTLDSLLALLTAAFPQAEVTTLRETLEAGLADSGYALADLYLWLGGYAAVGGTSANAFDPGTSEPGYAVIEITDRAAAEDFLRDALPGNQETEEVNGFTVFTLRQRGDALIIAINDTLMLVGMENPRLLDQFPPSALLADDADFQEALADLIAPAYNIFLYVTPELMGGSMGMMEMGMMGGMEPLPTAMGLTILEDTSLVIDMVQVGDLDAPSAIDPQFARFIPADASAVIHGTDLTALIDSMLEFSRMMSRGDGPDPERQLSGVFNLIGVDLRDDLLSWTTGDYALFLRTDVNALAEGIAEGVLDAGSYVDFGLLFEATDPEAASNFAAQLSDALPRLIQEDTPGVTLSSEDINGVSVSVIALQVPLDQRNMFELDVLIGATQDVFFIATRPAAESIINGGSSLLDSPAYQEASAYLLPNPTLALYADADGLLVGTVAPLALLGPSIGNIFDDVLEGLDEDAFVPAQTVYVQGSDEDEELFAALDGYFQLVSSSSISSTVSSAGNRQIRAVLTLNGE